MIKDVFHSYITAFVVTIFCIWVLMPVAQKIGLIDKPGGRKQHAYATPVVGGIAIFLGFYFSVLTLPMSMHEYKVLFACSAAMMFEGVIDDFIDVRTRYRLLVQVAVAILMVYWGKVAIHTFGYSSKFGYLNLGLWAGPLTIIVVVGFINAMNMQDGQDGLAGSLIAAQIILLLLLALVTGEHVIFVLLLLLLFAVIGFLIFNFPFPGRQHAKIFMGDAGSMFLSLAVSFFAIKLSQSRHFMAHFSPALMAWVLAFPVFDLITVSIARILKGRSPLSPGRDHMHHLLASLLTSKFQSTLILAVFSVLFGLLGMLFLFLHMPLIIYLLLFFISGVLYGFLYFFLSRKISKKCVDT